MSTNSSPCHPFPHSRVPRHGVTTPQNDGRTQTARRVLTVLESGEYFGESGVLTYFNGGGSKASTAPPAVTEQFSLVAGTNVELLVLRRKHYNIIEMQVRAACAAVSIEHDSWIPFENVVSYDRP